MATAIKYENGKVVQVSSPHITGEDAKKMLNAKVPKDLVERVKAKKFVTVSAESILENALRLDIEEQYELIDKLLKNIDSVKKDIEDAWTEEIQRRVQEYKDNKIQTIPFDEAFESDKAPNDETKKAIEDARIENKQNWNILLGHHTYFTFFSGLLE